MIVQAVSVSWCCIFTVAIGEFGVVYKAHLLSGMERRVRDLVAVKTLKGIHAKLIMIILFAKE